MTKDKQKICSHCEGRIAVEADTCLYCGMPLLLDSSVGKGMMKDSSLYAPPYTKNIANEEAVAFKQVSQKEERLHAIAIPMTEEMEEDVAKEKSAFIALFSALTGSSLLILGLMQALFSENGILRLEWNCKYWFLFCLLSLPLLYLGVKKGKA